VNDSLAQVDHYIVNKQRSSYSPETVNSLVLGEKQSLKHVLA